MSQMMTSNAPQPRTKSFAVVSGKGGSGKTLIAAAIAAACADVGLETLLVDADFGTGGLTYYLGFSAFTGARAGLSEFFLGEEETPSIAKPTSDAVRNHPWIERVGLLPVGSHRLIDKKGTPILSEQIREVISLASPRFQVIIFDCRGGIDDHSLTVCKSVDDIVLVAETDAASIQATQYLVNILSDAGLKKNVAGFILNKVMDDPSSLANAARSLFNAEHLGSVPFDITTTREFIKGNVIPISSMFCRHVFKATSNLLPELHDFEKIKTLSSEEYGSITLRDPSIRFGGFFVGALSLYIPAVVFTLPAAIKNISQQNLTYVVVFIYVMLVLGALSDTIKKSIGNSMLFYRRSFQQLFMNRRR
ncbi:AAA family ATPase [Rhizobium leguminosarum]|uniref:AAA family ATPase n=1 Tax=Rhizobium leguminosarum TaxID=384 RepID=UPI00144139AA|nr:AAA family ATPase [Rhizobium leguminosarum]NKL10371.1 AAA family ATPase [Rhizobium leguminosarum bv. viciae]NKL88429.1 AAA family ATPase [Rhizobium leguminosarum bv. viciae]NKL95425.1 AAA family ATPase [Rhizobium leguminosarum bv. viciae]NKM96502.1 AAA family ATPase [Rhizobium leguminosarum bv. viciae]